MSGPDTLLTEDSLYGGRLICRQYRQGYRFSIDAVLAAHFCRPGNRDRILDLGTGSGIIGLILAYRHQTTRIAGLEFQPDLVRLAENNADRNGLSDRFQIIEGDLRDIGRFVSAESFDLVVGNPPYHQRGRGRVNPDDQRARARHEIDSTLNDVARAAAFAVKNHGPVVIVYPADRTAVLFKALNDYRLEPKRLRLVYSYPEDDQARLVLVEAVKNGGHGLHVMTPLYVYLSRDGSYSAEMQNMYE